MTRTDTQTATRRPDARQADSRDWLGGVLIGLSMAGAPLSWLAVRRLGRPGGLLVDAGCCGLFARDMAMIATGAPSLLRPLPGLLLRAELVVSGAATAAGLCAWARPRPGALAVRVAAGAAAATFVLHSAREAIYLSPGQGRRRTGG